MGIFDRFKKKNATVNDYDALSALGNDPGAWSGLSNEILKQLIIVKCLEYGVSQDASRIATLFGLYRHAKSRLDSSERMKLLNQFSAMTEERKGQGHMGLMMFLAADDDPFICSTAAMSLAVLYDPQGGDKLAGPRFVVKTLLNQEKNHKLQGQALGGVLLLGDKRLQPLLEDAWLKLSDEARLGLTQAKSGFVHESMVEFWLRCLENGCSETVFGSAAAAIAKMPAITQFPFVRDVERVLPVYENSENPIRVLRQTSFADYLEEIRPRLEALERQESDPKVIPIITEIWEQPEKFRGKIN